MTAFIERLNAQDRRINDVSKTLSEHITECARIQKRVLVVGCLTLGWLVAHSPEAAGVIKALITTLP